MGKLIDVDALIKALGITDMNCERCAWYSGMEWNPCKMGSDFERACFVIEHTPEAVVRCKDCIYWDTKDRGTVVAKCSYQSAERYLLYTDADDYCSHGERKTDEKSI